MTVNSFRYFVILYFSIELLLQSKFASTICILVNYCLCKFTFARLFQILCVLFPMFHFIWFVFGLNEVYYVELETLNLLNRLIWAAIHHYRVLPCLSFIRISTVLLIADLLFMSLVALRQKSSVGLPLCTVNTANYGLHFLYVRTQPTMSQIFYVCKSLAVRLDTMSFIKGFIRSALSHRTCYCTVVQIPRHICN